MQVRVAASQKWWVMLGVSLGVLMSTLDVGIINVALPTLVQFFGTSFPKAQWAVLSYQLISSSLVLGATRLGDMWGKKYLYLGGLILFTLSSLLCGIAPSIDWLIGFRALQGLGSLFISGLSLAIVIEAFPSSERGRAVGIIGSVVSLGVALGPSVGGLLLGLSGWRILFFVNIPLGLVASLLVTSVVPPSVPHKEKQRFDLLGALLALITLGNFALGMTIGQSQGFMSGGTLWLLFLSLLGLISFLVVETLVDEPLLELQMFRNDRLSINLLNNWLVFIVITGGLLITPFFLQQVMQYPTYQVGLLMAVSPVVSGSMAPIAGTLSDRFGSRLMCLIGLSVLIGACVAISTLDATMTEKDFVVRYLLFGTGLGLFRAPNDSTVMGAVPRERLGIASGLLSLSRTLGVNVGISVIGAVFATLIANSAPGIDVAVAPPAAIVAGFQGSYRLAALLLCGAAVMTAVMKTKGERQWL
ncbi:DHA2 family efflux MFS transporter permease subunit [Scytonema sp. NUACC21]